MVPLYRLCKRLSSDLKYHLHSARDGPHGTDRDGVFNGRGGREALPCRARYDQAVDEGAADSLLPGGAADLVQAGRAGGVDGGLSPAGRAGVPGSRVPAAAAEMTRRVSRGPTEHDEQSVPRALAAASVGRFPQP